MIARAEVLGTNRTMVWFRLDHPDRPNAKLILTQPRADLPRGMADATEVDIEWDGVVHSGSEDTAPYSGYYATNLKVTTVEQERDTART